MKILIAEDEALTRMMLEFGLQTLGYEVTAAANGREAWEKYRSDPCQIVITDWNMPEMSGIDLVRRIRELSSEEYVFLILLTARTDKTDFIAGMDAGADDFIAKPFEPEELASRLRAARRMLEMQHAMARQKKELELWKARAEKTTEELKRSNADLDQFAYAAWHDLQAPLRTQETYTTCLADWKGKLDAAADDAITRILKSVEAMKEILDDLYEHSQVGGRDGQVAPVDCSLVASRAVANLQAAITASGSVVTLGALPTVPAVETEIMRLFQNLIGNALKYREENRPVQVRVSAQLEGCDWLFAVADDGIGFDPSQREKIFQAGKGSRLHSTRKYPGTGFGLSFCKKVVERHGGRIWADSEPGKGSTFYFTLPAE